MLSRVFGQVMTICGMTVFMGNGDWNKKIVLKCEFKN